MKERRKKLPDYFNGIMDTLCWNVRKNEARLRPPSAEKIRDLKRNVRKRQW